MDVPMPPAHRRPWAAVIKIIVLVVLIVAANHAFHALRVALDIDIRPSNEDSVHRIIMAMAGLYAVALAIPFVPGVEIGMGLMAALGLAIVPLVYLSTIAGLSLAFLIGRVVPVAALIRFSHDLNLRRLKDILCRFDAVPETERLAFLVSLAPGRMSRFLLRHRYIALALLINMPGNFLIGGGGGIALLSGMSRLFSWPVFLVVVAVAVAPVPLILLLFGAG